MFNASYGRMKKKNKLNTYKKKTYEIMNIQYCNHLIEKSIKKIPKKNGKIGVYYNVCFSKIVTDYIK